MNNQNTQNAGNKSNDKNFQASGKVSELQETIMKQIHDLGDSMERAGEKVEKAGWEKIGQAIYTLGNTLEHLNEGKTSEAKAGFNKLKTDFASASKDSVDKTDTAAKTDGKRSAY